MVLISRHTRDVTVRVEDSTDDKDEGLLERLPSALPVRKGQIVKRSWPPVVTGSAAGSRGRGRGRMQSCWCPSSPLAGQVAGDFWEIYFYVLSSSVFQRDYLLSGFLPFCRQTHSAMMSHRGNILSRLSLSSQVQRGPLKMGTPID